jgi:prevent-host-death family protein
MYDCSLEKLSSPGRLKSSYALTEAKAHLSRIVKHVEATGQEIILTRNGKPIARLVPDRGAGPRPLGFARGRVKFNEGWDQPLTYEELFAE